MTILSPLTKVSVVVGVAVVGAAVVGAAVDAGVSD